MYNLFRAGQRICFVQLNYINLSGGPMSIICKLLALLGLLPDISFSPEAWLFLDTVNIVVKCQTSMI